MKRNEKVLDLNEIIFEKRNKEYGAYILRRVYNKYVSISTTGGAILFAFIVSYPLITASLFPTEASSNNTGKDSAIIILTVPPIGKAPVDIPTPILPKTPTVKYVAPVVLPDEQVHNEDFATIDDFIDKNQGTANAEGNLNGTDIIVVVEPIDIPDVEPVIEQVHLWAEEMPKFPGGDGEMLSFFAKNTVYPEIAKRAGVEGKVILSFVVDKRGQINDVKVLKGIGAGCDEEAMRVLKSMPLWNPGRQNGKPILTRINIPVVFKLN